MTMSIALQLYSLRDSLAHNFEKGIREVARIGYAGVETSNFVGITPEAARKLFDDLGLAVAAVHADYPLIGDHQDEVLETTDALGCNRIILGGIQPEHTKTDEQVRRACDFDNEMQAIARAHGLSLGLHNHWWEFAQTREGHLVFDLMQKYLSPDIFFEVDTYWAKTAGQDPAALVSQLGRRAPLLHLKDGPAKQKQPQVAVGDGVMDIPVILKAGANHAEWGIVELDECATDMMEAVRKSYVYLEKINR
ncbi:MAG: sugar phosphate isomerase/epimerase family protein [Omnitrophica WOR_2 bacterium]